MSRYASAEWRPLTNRSTRTVQKDICCWHTAVSSSLAGTWNYFEGGAGGRGVYSHGMIGGGWGADLRDGLDGVAWQMQDTDLRAAANLDGNWHVIAWETADNAARPIAPWTPRQCAKIVEIMVEAYRVDGIPLELVPDSKPGRRGHAYHRLGCDPYRVDGGELWSSAYGKDCPTDPRIQQLPGLIARARATIAGGDDMSAEDVQAINDHTTAQAQEILRVLEANLGASAVSNPRAWLNAGLAMRLGMDEKARLAPLLDDEAKLAAAIEQLGVQPAQVDLDDVRAALRLALTDIRLTTEPAPAPAEPTA